MSEYTATDKTRYDVRHGTRYRNPPKPYRNKAERKAWKRQRQAAMLKARA